MTTGTPYATTSHHPLSHRAIVPEATGGSMALPWDPGRECSGIWAMERTGAMKPASSGARVAVGAAWRFVGATPTDGPSDSALSFRRSRRTRTRDHGVGSRRVTITPPADLHIGLTDGTFYGGDPFPAFAWMRAEAPAYFDETAGVWGITRYADIKEISKDPDTFSNAGGIRPDSDALPMMIDTDAPEHVRRRRLVSEGFTPRRIRESEEGIRIICDAIIDRVCERGTADFVTRHRRPAAHDRDRQHAGRRPRGPGRPAALVGRHAEGARFA